MKIHLLLLCFLFVPTNIIYSAAEKSKTEVTKDFRLLEHLTKFDRETILSHLGYTDLINLAHATPKTSQDLLNSIKAEIDNRSPLIKYWATGKIESTGMRGKEEGELAISPDGTIIADSSDNDIRLTRLPDKKTIGHIRSVLLILKQ